MRTAARASRRNRETASWSRVISGLRILIATGLVDRDVPGAEHEAHATLTSRRVDDVLPQR